MHRRSYRQPRRNAPRRLAGLAAVLGVTVLTSADTLGPTSPGSAASAHKPVGTVVWAASNPPHEVALSASHPRRLRIPAIGIDTTAIADLGLRADRTMEVPADAGTVGWYKHAPTPGERGPALLAAHVDWKNQKGVFHDLRKLSPGNQVIVERADGSVASFTTLRVDQYPKDRFPTQMVFGEVGGPELRLVTCGGQFDQETGSYQDNIVVYAKITKVRR